MFKKLLARVSSINPFRRHKKTRKEMLDEFSQWLQDEGFYDKDWTDKSKSYDKYPKK